MMATKGDWIRDGKLNVIIQTGMKAAPGHADVPLALDLAKNHEDHQVMEILCSPSATGYPSFMGPDVPKDRVEAVRAAFRQTMKDPRFIAALQKQRLELDPIEGDEIDGVVKNLYAMPPTVVDRMRELMPPSE
jgi:hypothetical protein